MWFVRLDLLRASGTEPPTWSQFVNAFWRQLFAFDTYRENSLVFPQQSVRHSGHFTEADELRPYHPACYSLSDHQFTPHRCGEPQFVKPTCPCPLQTMRSRVREHSSEVGGWRDWARLSVALAQPKHRKVSEAWALAIAESIRATACQEHEACPFNASSHVFAPRRGSHQVLQSHEDLEPAGGCAAWVNPPNTVAATNHQEHDRLTVCDLPPLTVHFLPPLIVHFLPPLTVHFYHPSQFIFYHPSQFIFNHPSQYIVYYAS